MLVTERYLARQPILPKVETNPPGNKLICQLSASPVMLLNMLRSPPLYQPSPPPAVAEFEAKRQPDGVRDSVLSVTPGSGETFRDRLADGEPCPVCPQMVVAPAGEFLMGSTPSEIDMLTKEPSLAAFPRAAEFSKKEEPQHRVTIARPFAVGSFAVTFAEWDACVADGGCSGYLVGDIGWGRGKQPIISVNWDDAQGYAAWLSRKTGNTCTAYCRRPNASM